MRTMNRKGLANIIAMISLILITTIAAVTVSVSVDNFFASSETQLSSDFSCLDLQSSSVVQIKKACYNAEDGDVELTLERKVSSLDIPQLDFTINGESSESYSCSNSCGNCNVLGLGASKTYYFESEADSGEVIVHVAGCQLDSAEIRGSC